MVFLGKRGEFDQVRFGNSLNWVAGFAPGGEASVDYVGAEAVLPE
jgi:hypothetical protein